MRTSNQTQHSSAPVRGLRYKLDDSPGYTRRRSGKSFVYLDSKGRPINDDKIIARIQSLVIPPAWKDVWISPFPDSHLQVTGIDARGRKQYRYHEKWRQARDESKFEKLVAFAACLPKIRNRVQHDMNLKGLPRQKVLATVVRLLEATCIRIGNESYARENESYGLTTMRNYHVNVKKCDIRFRFKGKSGKSHDIQLTDCMLAGIVKKCRSRPGELLFQYTDAQGIDRKVTSTDVNRYLREISGQSITAKDYRTWWGTLLAALLLNDCETATSQSACRRTINGVIKEVAAHLGNTPTVCRKSYIHPSVIEAYCQNRKIGRVIKRPAPKDGLALLPEEQTVLRFLKSEWARSS